MMQPFSLNVGTGDFAFAAGHRLGVSSLWLIPVGAMIAYSASVLSYLIYSKIGNSRRRPSPAAS
jgi:hypothetical protein